MTALGIGTRTTLVALFDLLNQAGLTIAALEVFGIDLA